MMEALLIRAGVSGVLLFGVLNLAGLHTWLERKQSAVMQDRVGANRASIFGLRLLGLFHPLADAIKMFMKEDFVPPQGNRVLHTIAPWMAVFFALIAFATIPFGDTIPIAGRVISLQVADLNVGLLYVLAMLSMGVYGVILAGYSSNSNYAFLGGIRAASQVIAYEITLGATLVGLIMVYQTLSLQDLVRAQGGYLWGVIPLWGVVVQPVGALLFMTAALAETKRVPFDLPEGESEIVGYFVEYSGMKFGMFFLTDFVETVLLACLMTTLFFGGWQVPHLQAGGFVWPWGTAWGLSPLTVSLLQIGSFTVKVLAFCWLFMAIRWTLPRFRYDQLMHLGWKILLPLSLANIVITGILLLMVDA